MSNNGAYRRALKIWLRGHSKSLNVAPFDRSYTTSHQSGIIHYTAVQINHTFSFHCSFYKRWPMSIIFGR